MIDSMIDETLFVVKNLDNNLKQVAEKQKKLDEKIKEYSYISYQIDNKNFTIKTFDNIKFHPSEIRFTKVLTKYSTEYNNMLFIEKTI